MTYFPNPEWMVTDLGDELMLVHGARGEVMRMNSTARTLWLALPGNEATLSSTLSAVFDVDDARARLDCAQQLQQWSAMDLVSHKA